MSVLVQHDINGTIIEHESWDGEESVEAIKEAYPEIAAYILYDGDLNPSECVVRNGGLVKARGERASESVPDGKTGRWIDPRPQSEIKNACLSEVDALAENARSKIVTPGSGQSMTYEAKHQEALAGGGVMLQLEADALGVTLQEVVDSVLAARQAWLVAGGQIEAARLKAKRDMRAATTAADMHQITETLRQELSL